jgi:hypothetical protein
MFAHLQETGTQMQQVCDGAAYINDIFFWSCKYTAIGLSILTNGDTVNIWQLPVCPWQQINATTGLLLFQTSIFY